MKIRNTKGEFYSNPFFKNANSSVLSVNKKPITSKNGLLYEVYLKIMREGWCENDWRYENIERNGKTFAGMPILCAYIKNPITGEYKIGDNHNFEKVKDSDGNLKIDTRGADAERIVGKINDNEDEIVIKEEKGKQWIYAKGVLYGWYHPQLVEQILELGTVSISAETLTDPATTKKEEGTNREIFYDWIGTGVTILGEEVPPAMPEANITLMMMSKEIKEKVQSIENMSIIDKNGSKQNNQKGEGERVEKVIELKDFENLFPNSKLICLSTNKDYIIMVKDNAIVSYKLDEKMLSAENFDINSLKIEDKGFCTLEATEKNKKLIRTMSVKVNEEELDVDIEDEYHCEGCEEKQNKINEMQQEKEKMQEDISSLNEKILQYEKEKKNNEILNAVMKEQAEKEYDGIEEEKKVPKEKMQTLFTDIKEGKYLTAEEAIKEYKSLYADNMEAYDKANRCHNGQTPIVNSMGNLPNPFNSNSQTKDPVAYARERFGGKNN